MQACRLPATASCTDCDSSSLETFHSHPTQHCCNHERAQGVRQAAAQFAAQATGPHRCRVASVSAATEYSCGGQRLSSGSICSWCAGDSRKAVSTWASSTVRCPRQHVEFRFYRPGQSMRLHREDNVQTADAHSRSQDDGCCNCSAHHLVGLPPQRRRHDADGDVRRQHWQLAVLRKCVHLPLPRRRVVLSSKMCKMSPVASGTLDTSRGMNGANTAPAGGVPLCWLSCQKTAVLNSLSDVPCTTQTSWAAKY